MPPTTGAPPTRADLIDPASLASLGRIEIIARWVVDGFLSGLHRSPRKGFSVEFAEFRPYQTGDDLRFIDWRVVARSDKWMVKQFEEETNTRAALVLDVSKSMDWSGSPERLTKLRYAEQVVAAIALLLIRQRDAVGLVRYDDRLRTVLPARARTMQWRRIVRSLEEPGAGSDSRMAEGVQQAAKLIRRPGIVILLSDLLVDQDQMEQSLRVARAAGHQVTVLHIMDPSELELDSRGEAIFYDPESTLEVTATVSDVRRAYSATVMHAIEEWRQRLAALGAGYEVIRTDSPFGVPLRRAFATRQRLP
ncbi:MAG TPA: DUF58 domain-containing protein [Gemmatimonadaceae bacterium]|nr:DUF58 domain-containing protein [Gemmatimonadaceae bacterium]